MDRVGKVGREADNVRPTDCLREGPNFAVKPTDLT